MNLSKIDIIILKDLHTKNKNSFLKSASLQELIAYKSNILKPNSLYKRIIQLKKQGLLQEGAKDGKMKSYYITDLGIEVVNKF